MLNGRIHGPRSLMMSAIHATYAYTPKTASIPVRTGLTQNRLLNRFVRQPGFTHTVLTTSYVTAQRPLSQRVDRLCFFKNKKNLPHRRSHSKNISTCSRWFEQEGEKMVEKREIILKAEELVKATMKGNDASHDAAHAYRVRDLALSLVHEEGLSASPDSLLIVELAALLHDIGDHKYIRDPSEGQIVENFLTEEGVDTNLKTRILSIIQGMGFKEEIGGLARSDYSTEFGVVQDADRLDAIGAIGIARCFTFGGSRNRVLHDPDIKPRSDLTKEVYMNKNEQTTINHFHEKLFKLKDLMKTKAGQRRAEKRHKFMEQFVEEFYEEWDGKA